MKIVAGGTLTVDGLVDASPSDLRPTSYTKLTEHYPAPGGSIWLTAARMAGTGKIRANGGNGTTAHGTGGGRIALYLTDPAATFDSVGIAVECYGGSKSETSPDGTTMPGTIYRQLADDRPQGGELMVIGRDLSDIGRMQLADTNLTQCTPLLANGVAATTYNFRKITLFGSARLAVSPNVTLDLTGTTIEAGQGTKADALLLAGGTLRLPGDAYTFKDLQLWTTGFGSTIEFTSENGEGTLTLEKGGRFDAKIRIPGSLVLAGGKLIHTAQGSSALRYAIDIETTGDLTVASGASIAADRIGYSGGPGTSGMSGIGASYGGFAYRAETLGKCYGDPRNPTEPGSSGGCQGGGLVKLVVGGKLTVDGPITARGEVTYNVGGSGGAINITAGEIAGSATLNASSMNDYLTGYVTRWGGTGSGGGGRIAVTLTKEGATFDDYTGVMEVCGSSGGTDQESGNGTIYLRLPDQAIDEGTLILDAKNLKPGPGAGIVAANSGITVGDVVLRNKGVLDIRKGCALNVKGDFSNDGTGAVAGELGDAENDPGAVAFVDADVVSKVTGVTSFAKFSCTEPGKTLRFGGEGSELRIDAGGVLELRGSGEDGVVDTPVYLRGMDDETPWKIAIADGAQADLQYLDVDRSDASESPLKPSARDSVGDKERNPGWTFVNIKVGEEITWTGESGTGWGNPGCWDLGRAPVDTDTVIIPAGCAAYPHLSAGVSVYELRMQGGSTLTLEGFPFEVKKSATVAGTLVCSAKEQISFLGDVDFTGGGFVAADSTVTIAGTKAQTVSLGGLRFNTVVLANTATATFAAGFGTKRLSATAAGAEIAAQFGEGIEVRADQLWLDGGSGASPLVTLVGVGGAAWKLTVSQFQQVRGVAVSDCDASGGRKIWDDAPYVDCGRNANWGFSDGAIAWTGAGANADFTNELTWAGGRVPTATDRVKLTGGETINLTEDALVGELDLLGGETHLTAANGAKLKVAGVFYVQGGSKCFLDVPTEAGSAFVRTGALVVHTPCTTTSAELHSIDLAVTGDMEIEPGGYLDALARGFSAAQGYGTIVISGGYTGAPHGGYPAGSSASRCYGSVFAPVCPGSGGSNDHKGPSSDSTVNAHGGGVIRLQVGGTLLLDGTVTADAWTNQNHYGAAGGSVWMTVGRLAGSGKVSARGGLIYGGSPGCGGRIAVYRTDETADESAFTGTILAIGGGTTSANSPASTSPGTVYLADKDTPEKGGTVIIDNDRTGGSFEFSRTGAATPLPVAANMRGDEAKDFRDTVFKVGVNAAFRVNENLRVKDVSLESASSYLVIPTPATEEDKTPVLTIESLEHKHGIGWIGKTLPAGTGTGRRKKYDYIKWILPGLMLFVR